MSKLFSTKHRMFWSRLFAGAVVAYILFYRPPAIMPEWALEILEVVGFALLALAAFGRLWCVLFIGGRKNNILMMEGPYSTVRNPLYVFSLIGAVGFGLCVENPCLSLVLAVVFVAYYSFVIRQEERILASAFGKAFDDYAARTPRWIPSLKLYKEPETLVTHPRRFRKGIFDAMWFILAVLLWEVIETLRQADLWQKGM